MQYIPAQDGFVFSNAEIDRTTERFHRLQLAKQENDIWKKQSFGNPERPQIPKATKAA